MSPDVQSKVPPAWDVVDRYLSGEATPNESDTVEMYLSRQPEAASVLKRLSSEYAGRDTDTLDVSAAWTTLVERLATASAKTPASRARTRGLSSISVWQRGWSVALGALASVLVLIVGWSVVMHRPGARQPVSTTTYATRNGQRADITLADGSTVSLNVGSQLDVPTDYAMGNRVLKLHGEALFAVTHRTDKPFVVVTGNTSVHVLGTSFVVRRYATDTATMVAVRDGKVAVQAVPVTALQRADVTSDGRVHVGMADRSLFEFAAGTLVLDWMPLRDAIPALERWYDARIVIADSSMLTRQMKGEFVVGSVADLSQILSVTLHARVLRDGHILTIAQQ